MKQNICFILQDTIYNPYDGQGLDLWCKTHECFFNIETERGDWEPITPEVCPTGKSKLH